MLHSLNITLAQLNPTVGDLRGNLQKIRRARDTNLDSDLIIFSELIVTGYPADDLIFNVHFIEQARTCVEQLVEESKNIKPALLISTPWVIGGITYNAALLIEDGKIVHTALKHRLPNDGVFDDKRVFAHGTLPDTVDFHGTKLGIMICEDMWHADAATHFKKQGAELLIVTNGSVYQIDIEECRKKTAQKRVQEVGLPLLYVNQVGGQDDLVFDGASFAMDISGNITHQLPSFEESIFNLNKNSSATLPDKTEEIYKAVTLGLRDYVRKNKFSGILIGLSGGIDSALAATIAVDAIGADNVHCVMMPSPYTSQDSLDDARQCAELLGVQLDTISIEPAMTAFNNMLDGTIDKNTAGTTFENIQSRARGITLMALSNASGKMVLSTGNKSEMAVGYATLYGDMCGGYNPLKDLYKTQVYKLAKWRNQQGRVIPDRIITKAPTAELKDNQTDQDTLPPYEVLDDILEYLIEKDTAPQDIPHDRDTVLKVWKMLDMAEYKRRQAPPGPKITSKAFGRDRRYPITNGFFKSEN